MVSTGHKYFYFSLLRTPIFSLAQAQRERTKKNIYIECNSGCFFSVIRPHIIKDLRALECDMTTHNIFCRNGKKWSVMLRTQQIQLNYADFFFVFVVLFFVSLFVSHLVWVSLCCVTIVGANIFTKNSLGGQFYRHILPLKLCVPHASSWRNVCLQYEIRVMRFKFEMRTMECEPQRKCHSNMHGLWNFFFSFSFCSTNGKASVGSG